MTARTRKWVVLSALGLLSLDLALVAVAAPKARGWLESARGSALVRAGTNALRDFGGAAAPLAAREARWVMVETRCEQEMAADGPSSCSTPGCEPSSRPSSSCPNASAPQGTVSGSSATGLPASMLGMTLE